jgi:hypothetical protein
MGHDPTGHMVWYKPVTHKFKERNLQVKGPTSKIFQLFQYFYETLGNLHEGKGTNNVFAMLDNILCETAHQLMGGERHIRFFSI